MTRDDSKAGDGSLQSFKVVHLSCPSQDVLPSDVGEQDFVSQTVRELIPAIDMRQQ